MTTEIRKATKDDSNRLTEIAHAAKRHWGYPERWIDIWKGALTITPDFILSNEVFTATIDGEVVGFYALTMRGNKATLEHLWVLPDRIGTGIGKELFHHAVAKAASLNAETIEIESDPNAEGFYRRMGARHVGEIISEIEGKQRALPLLVYEMGLEID
ncbi:MAG TPA: GNAT family N-acetyltransferase [Blastocatellia bacterium]|nr:GNAT family N-acetyltransferase [Blastocatellia bacterium]